MSSKFNVGDVVRVTNLSYSGGDMPTVRNIEAVVEKILAEDYYRGETQYYIRFDIANGLHYNVVDSELELIRPQYMRRVIEKGNLVKVIGKPDVFMDLDEKVKELGGTDKYSNKYVPKVGEEGDVLGIDDGYVLVGFKGAESLLDISCLEVQKRKDEVKYLVLFPTKLIEEYSSEKEVEKRMQELYKQQSLKPGEVIKVYDVNGYREVGVKIEIAFI